MVTAASVAAVRTIAHFEHFDAFGENPSAAFVAFDLWLVGY